MESHTNFMGIHSRLRSFSLGQILEEVKVKLFLGWHLLAYLLGHKDFEEAFAIFNVLNVFGVNLILGWRILV